MTLLDLQRRHRRLGKLRLGKRGDKGQPVRLNTWRLTSQSRELILQAAELWGGEPKAWRDNEMEVVTTTDSLPVWVPPQDVESHMELWSAGGRQRRCDGVTCLLTKQSSLVEVECMCDPAEPECTLTTRFNFILPDLADLGVWVYESHGKGAATELAAAVELVAGRAVDAQLAIEQDSRKIPGQGTHRWNKAVLRIPIPLRHALRVGEAMDLTAPQEHPALEAGNTPVGQEPSEPMVSPEPPPDLELEEVRARQIAALKAAAVESGSPPEDADRHLPSDTGEVQTEESDIRADGGDPFARFLHPSAQEPEDAEIIEFPSDEGEDAEVIELVTDRDVVLTDIETLLADGPSKSDTMQVWEAHLRELFQLMGAAGLWVQQPHDRYDPLHKALAKRQYQHVGDMKKAALIDFTEKARAAAKELLAEATE